MDEPFIVIIVLSWNGKEDTLECLKSLEQVVYPNYKVLVVDNGSNDDTATAVRNAYPGVEVIETGANLGFAEGNNVGIRRALERGADAVLLLNNDTTVEPDFLQTLVTALYRSPDIGAANPAIYYYDHPSTIWSAGGTIDQKTGIAYQRHIDEVDIGQMKYEEVVDYGVGAALLIKKEAIEAAGLLDPDFFLYYEETDWCARAREAGYKTIVVPSAKIRHKVSRAVSNGSAAQLYYFCRNRLRFMSKRGTGQARLGRIALGEFGRLALSKAVHGDRKRSAAVVRAVADFYLDRFGKAEI